jgi:hypothetical protein
MKLAIMQPYLFPYIGYWQLIQSVDTFVIFDDVHFIKKGFIHRNTILYQGEPWRFTLELLRASQNKLINQIEVGNNARKLLKSIETAYKKAPCFDDIFPILEKVFLNNEKNLALFTGDSLEIVSDFLEIDTKFVYSSSIKKEENLKGAEKILQIATILGAKHYINAIGGQELYTKDYFERNGIKLSFLQTHIIPYKQFNEKFVPNLSIIDMMMFLPKTEIRKMLGSYRLI